MTANEYAIKAVDDIPKALYTPDGDVKIGPTHLKILFQLAFMDGETNGISEATERIKARGEAVSA